MHRFRTHRGSIVETCHHTISPATIAKVLDRHGYQYVRQTGSHMIFKYRNDDTGELRTVSVPDHDRIRTGTLRKIMKQAGGEDFDAFCEWIEDAL